jgi:hypothetical protein
LNGYFFVSLGPVRMFALCSNGTFRHKRPDEALYRFTTL